MKNLLCHTMILSSLFFLGVWGKVAEAQTAAPVRSAEILLQADTYTPPFYRGKALPTGENTISAVAYPDLTGTSLNPAQLHYKWMRDGVAIPGYAGVGKRFVSFDTSIASDQTLLEVEIANPAGSYRAKKAMYLNDRSPKALVYEDNAALGVLYNKVVPKEFALLGSEAAFLGIPYFFSAGDLEDSNLSYAWSVGGESTAQRLPRLTVRSEGGSGVSPVSLQVNHKSKYEQAASYRFTISFDEQRSR